MLRLLLVYWVVKAIESHINIVILNERKHSMYVASRMKH
jgi:hypothetical protein